MTAERSLEAEVEEYLIDSHQGTNSLSIWTVCFTSILFVKVSSCVKDIGPRFPTVLSLALDVLPIQASSVPCERVFSSGKETTTPRRSRISPDLMEALQVLKFSVRQGVALSFTTGMDWDDELKELESGDLHSQRIPEDIGSFIRMLLDNSK
jgi:hypothetical protein